MLLEFDTSWISLTGWDKDDWLLDLDRGLAATLFLLDLSLKTLLGMDLTLILAFLLLRLINSLLLLLFKLGDLAVPDEDDAPSAASKWMAASIARTINKVRALLWFMAAWSELV
jgi:hypothetical protein